MTAKFGIALSAAALALGAAATTAEARPRETGQQQLDRLLQGRVAGKPVSCIPAFANDQVRIIDRTALVYGSGNTIYVNRPRDPSNLDDDDILVSRRFGSQICKLDMVRLHDRATRTYSGFVNLEDFVPYRRVSTARR
ncbi:MAG: hypothetical protein ACTHLU_03665 [Novosphingobium sp.]